MTDSASLLPLADRITELPRPFDMAASARLHDVLAAETLPANALALATGVAGSSPFLARLLHRKASELARLFAAPPERSLAAVLSQTDAAGDLTDPTAAMRALRAAKADAALLAALCEISGAWTSLDAGAALSDFADAATNAALRNSLRGLGSKGFRHADRDRCETASGVAVIAMGKLGARELNFSSDIDLVILFDPEAEALGGPDDARAIAIAAARNMVRLLNEQTAGGYVFRTDLRLRPDPGVSAAAISLRAAESYYEAHGQNWERAAYVRARAAAGDLRTGESFLRSLRPFVWRKYLDYAAIEDIHSIKRQIHAAKGGAIIEFRGHDIKTGRGGIRELEFLVQTQQLILGGKQPEFRARATLDAAAALAAAGRIRAFDHALLESGYRYLRRVEHRIQMINDEQTHKIPRDDAGVERLAVFLNEESAGAFEHRLGDVLRSTHRLFAELFEREERLSAGGGSLIFTGVENDSATLETLRKMGFRRAEDVSDTIRRWHAGSLRATRSRRARELLTKLGPRLLGALSQSGDPDAAFVAFDRFLSRLPGGVQVFSLFANNPDIFDTLIRIMTISPFLGLELSRRRHLIEALLDKSWPGAAPAPRFLAQDLSARLARHDSYEEKLNEARRWGAERRFDAAAQLAIGLIDAPEAARRFTAAANAAICALLPIVRAENVMLYGAIDGEIAVIGLGRLGAGAMTAASDIDLVFIYDAPEQAQSSGEKPLDAATWHMRLVRRILAALSATTAEGALYEVDMQLRPSGNKGPWAVSLGSFERYYDGDAWTWEEMALVKARVVAGDAPLADRIADVVCRIIERPRDPSKLGRDVHEMRLRLAGAKIAAGPWDLKRAEGGLTDLDFIVQYLVLRHAACIGAPPPDLPGSLTHLADSGAVERSDAAMLIGAFEAFEKAMQVSRAATGAEFVPDDAGPALQKRMSEIFGVSGIEEATVALVEIEGFVKRAYMRIVAAAAPPQ